MNALERSWYKPCGWSLALAPLSIIFAGVVSLRRLLYRHRVLNTTRLSVPVVVVGNISVGGNGKTPISAYLAKKLREKGLKVGIVSRGYGAKAPEYPWVVGASTSSAQAGDEPVLLAKRGDAVVAVDPVRPRAAQKLIDDYQVDIILADDGLQHYALGRDIELCIIDGKRGLGNNWLLPAGPLREPKKRLAEVDLVLTQGEGKDFWLCAQNAISMAGQQQRALHTFSKVHALAGIGAPGRFFTMLERLGIEVIAHPFADHYVYDQNDISFGDDLPVVMTEKDAVKCLDIASSNHWYIPVEAQLAPAKEKQLEHLVARLF